MPVINRTRLRHDAFPHLAQLFLGRNGQLPGAARRALAAADCTRQAREGLAATAPGIDWRTAWRQILGRLPELLDLSVLDLLLAGGEQSSLFAQIAERSRLDPGRLQRVPLPRLTLVSEHHPRLDLLVNGNWVGELDFTATVAFEFTGAQVVLEEGRLRALHCGACIGRGELLVGGTRFHRKDFGRLRLPAEVYFEPGFAAPTAEHPYLWGEGPAQAASLGRGSALGTRPTRTPLLLVGLAVLGLGLLVGRELDDGAAAPPVTLPQPGATEPTAPQSSPLLPALPVPEGPAAPVTGAAGDAADITYTLTILPDPPDARVRILNIGPRYVPAMPLAPGAYHVRVDHPGYVTRESWVDLDGRDLVLDIALTREAEVIGDAKVAPPPAVGYRVTLRTDPAAASVAVVRDGRVVPFQSGDRLPPGSYRFAISHPGYRPAIRFLRVTDRDTQVAIRLQRDFIH